MFGKNMKSRLSGWTGCEYLAQLRGSGEIDHLVYKFQICKIFMCLLQKNATDFADNPHCRLGKWYSEGEG